MGGERDRQRSEPSISGEGIDNIDNHEPSAQVDLDQLLNEIDNSRANSSIEKNTVKTRSDWRDEAEISSSTDDLSDDELPTMRPLEQSALDFGEIEPSYKGERKEPLPDFTDDNMNGEKAMSRGVVMAGGALVALSLLFGVIGMFTALSASGKITALQQSVDALQTKMATMQVSGDPRVGQLQAEQAGLTSRLDEMSAKIDGLASAPAKGGDAQVVELRKRLDALEHKPAQAAKTATAPATANHPTKTASAKPSAAKSPAHNSGDWTVILVSFTSSAQAESERTRLQKVGIHAEVLKSQVDGKPWYRVRVPGYATQEAAKAAIDGLERKSGINGAWIAHI